MKKYFITGLLVWVPLAITAWLLQFIVSAMDLSMGLLPQSWHPEQILGFRIWGLGALLTLLIVLLTGVIASNFFGQKLVEGWESLLSRIPVVKSIYSSVKQVSDTLLGPSGQAFRKALLVQYPRQGCWTIAFMTGQPSGELLTHTNADLVSIYVPTTPNPTSGFFLMMPRSEVIDLDMTVDEALKYIISMGVVGPEQNAHAAQTQQKPTA